MERYRALKQRIIDFVENQRKTNVRYLFFRPMNGKLVPEINDSLRVWNVRDTTLFVTSNKDAWLYVYQPTTIKYLVTQHVEHGLIITDKISTDIEDVIDAETKKRIVNHGDHLTASLLLTRTQELFLKTHKTMYEEKMDPPFEFERTELYCVVQLDPENIRISPSSQCYVRGQEPNPYDTLQMIYRSDPILVDAVQQVAKVLNGKVKGGTRQPIIHTGPRNGKYIIVNSKKKYMTGGNPFAYKTISFNDTFIAFIKQHIIDKVYRHRTDVISVRMIYDERNDLHRNANKYIVILYDLENDAMQLYYIDARKAMMACFALQNETIATVEEKTCLQEFLTNVQHNIPHFVMSGGT